MTVARKTKIPRRKFKEVAELFPKYRSRETFSEKFLELSPNERARRLRKIYELTFNLNTKAGQFDIRARNFLDYINKTVKEKGEQQFLKEISRFSLGCTNLFNTIKETFSREENGLIFSTHMQDLNAFEHMVHRLYFTRESFFETCEAAEGSRIISENWRKLMPIR